MTTAARRRGLSEAQTFGLRFFAFLILASVIAWGVTLPSRLGPAQRGIAAAATWLAHGAGSAARVKGDQISAAGMVIDINYECTGVYVLLILFVFLLAYPSTWRARISGAAIGVVALTLLNVFRIAFLIRAAELQPELFSYLHEYVWQGIFLVLTIVYAMTWVERVR
jgi:exosortase/archaeosortase family protein